MRIAKFEQVETAPENVPPPPRKPIPTAPTQIAEVEESPQPSPAEPPAAGKADPVTTASLPEDKATDVAKSDPPQLALNSGSMETTGSLPTSSTTPNTLWRDAAMVFAFTLVALVALSFTILMRRRGYLSLPAPAAWISHGPEKLPALTGTSLSTERNSESDELGDIPATRLRLWDEGWLPSTMNEAFDVLGVDPEASKETMKRTVTRLRRALHPDHAMDEDDRRLRERRLKQINVAWELVAGRRRPPWHSATS